MQSRCSVNGSSVVMYEKSGNRLIRSYMTKLNIYTTKIHMIRTEKPFNAEV